MMVVNAMSDAMQILEMNEESAEAWNLRGNIHVIYAEYHEAVMAYSEALRLDPLYARAFHNRGLAYLMSYRPIQGCDDLERSLELGHSASADAIKYFCGF
jgi:lipoprotein NlpI